MNQNLIKLSASKIKTLTNCSWLYYCNYVLKLPKTSNDGARRGTICHSVFELLLKPKHKKHFNLLTTGQSLKSSLAIDRLVKIYANKEGVADADNIALIEQMILTAIKHDFYCQNATDVKPEVNFELESEDYQINGFIDKMAIYSNDSVKIWDYKTSKEQFSDSELEYNLQVLMYSLACYRMHKVIPEVSFLFLRFPKDPVQNAPKCSEGELDGFEEYLSYLSKYLKKFDVNTAKCDLAANNKERRWLCGYNKFKGQLKKDGTTMWCCEFKYAFKYFALLDETNKVKKTAFKIEELIPLDGEVIQEMSYSGCPYFKDRVKSQVDDDI